MKARLREGVTVAQAKAAMDVLARRLAAEYPDQFRTEGEFALGTGITVIPSTDVRIHPQADAPFMAIASLVLVIVGLVLAIACSNLATLLLVRGAARAKEVSVRLAMGATRRQLVRHLLTESLLLSLAGGIAGCILAWWGMRALQGIDLPVRVDLTLDYRVLAFAIALSLVTGVAFGLAPALKATRVDLLPTLRDEGLQPIDHRRLTLKNALIVFQVAVSVLLLGGTSIFLQMLAATQSAARRLCRRRRGDARDRSTVRRLLGDRTRGACTTSCCAGSRPFLASNPPRCCAACRWRPTACRSSSTAAPVRQGSTLEAGNDLALDRASSTRCASRCCTAACSTHATARTRLASR